ncbi:glycoside hydrolase family 3 protein [Tessaracoccus sp.]
MESQDKTDIAAWSIEKVVGQLFCVSVGHHVDGGYQVADSLEATSKLVREHHVGGVCYFPVGAEGSQPASIRRVIRSLQAEAGTPLIISIDQEGGLVTRMREPATRWPSAMAQAAGADWDAVQRIAHLSGDELRAVGVNHVYAPVADVNTEPRNPVIGIRSPSSSPHVVAQYDRAVVFGLAEADVASCLKHFPGHGNTHVDSHAGTPLLHTSLEQWEATEAIPFMAGIAAGTDSVMVGHLRAPGLDPTGTLATFSAAIVTGLLREKLGFDGVIVTDALDMEGAQMKAGPGAMCVAALQAGIDQLLMPRNPEACIDAVVAAVAAGTLDEANLRSSATRILTLKRKLGLLERSDEDAFGGTGEQEAADTIARSLTWRDPGVAFALEPGVPVTVVSDPEPPSAGRGIEDVPTELARALEGQGHPTRVAGLGETVAPDTTCVLVIRDAWRFPNVADMVQTLCAGRSAPSCVIAARSPYDSMIVDASRPLLLTYGDIPGVARQVAAVLTGRDASGVLPIDLPEDPDGGIGWPRRLSIDVEEGRL